MAAPMTAAATRSSSLADEISSAPTMALMAATVVWGWRPMRRRGLHLRVGWEGRTVLTVEAARRRNGELLVWERVSGQPMMVSC